MTERTSKEIVNQAIADFDSIKEAILGHKIDVPYPTKTCEYSGLIAKIRVGCIAGNIYNEPEVLNCNTLCDKALTIHDGRVVNTLTGLAEVINEEE